jgi:hypothetical protein
MVDVPELEDQDQAEVMDETNLTRDGDDIANFDEIPDVLDVTSTIGDDEEDTEDDAADEGDDGDPRDLVDEFSDGDDDEEVDDSPRTRLEDRPEDTNLLDDDDDVEGTDETDINERDPMDAPAGDEPRSADRSSPSQLESSSLSDEQIAGLGYKGR